VLSLLSEPGERALVGEEPLDEADVSDANDSSEADDRRPNRLEVLLEFTEKTELA
jgi:hypothetical protein